MLEQRVTNRPVGGMRGVALIALIAASVIVGSNFFYFLGRWIGSVSSLLFIIYGIFIAWLLLDWYVKGYIYTCGNGCLRVCRTYGRYERFMADIWLNGLQACGTLEDMKCRFPKARVQRAVKPECSLESLAVAYNDAGRTAIMVLQPDADIRGAIINAVRKG